MNNTLKTAILLTLLSAVLLAMGRAFGGHQGLVTAGGLAMLMALGSYWFSDKLVLAMYHAQPVDPSQAPELYEMAQRLAARAGIPAPRLYLIPSMSPNAFATGRNPAHGVVAVTQGLVRMMNREELEGVIAHEIGHIAGRDTLIMAVVTTLTQAIMMLRYTAFFMGRPQDNREGSNPAEAMLMFVLAPIVGLVIQLAISRTREYKADATAARLAGHPHGLVAALKKLGGMGPMPDLGRHPEAQHLFIASPLTGGWLFRLFSTHPSMEDRIAALLGRPA